MIDRRWQNSHSKHFNIQLSTKKTYFAFKSNMPGFGVVLSLETEQMN